MYWRCTSISNAAASSIREIPDKSRCQALEYLSLVRSFSQYYLEGIPYMESEVALINAFETFRSRAKEFKAGK